MESEWLDQGQRLHSRGRSCSAQLPLRNGGRDKRRGERSRKPLFEEASSRYGPWFKHGGLTSAQEDAVIGACRALMGAVCLSWPAMSRAMRRLAVSCVRALMFVTGGKPGLSRFQPVQLRYRHPIDLGITLI